jgi:hypothetical protein
MEVSTTFTSLSDPIRTDRYAAAIYGVVSCFDRGADSVNASRHRPPGGDDQPATPESSSRLRRIYNTERDVADRDFDILHRRRCGRRAPKGERRH